MRLPGPVLLLALLAASSEIGLAKTISGAVIVTDGDTLTIADQTIRLYGIDAPETGQRCAAAGRKMVRPSRQAIKSLKRLSQKGLMCEGRERDNFNRLIARCKTPDGIDVNAAMVAQGHAWAFVTYSTDYVGEEQQARERGANIWSMRCEEPWVFRERRWMKNAGKAPKGCAIKGNISESGRIYHMPWNKAYAKTVIDPSQGEKWFCDEGAAQAAGWRPARN